MLHCPIANMYIMYAMPNIGIYCSRNCKENRAERVEDQLQMLEETGRVPSREKFRRMICNTFVATGACPYGDRCVFLHDYRLRSEATDVRPTRQTRNSNLTKDTFYWPDMVRKDTSRFLDAQGLPDANQRYTIPAAFASPHSSFHNRGLYSMWGHFVGFCIQSNEQRRDNTLRDDDPSFAESEDPYNRLLPGRKRLGIFVDLATNRLHDSKLPNVSETETEETCNEPDDDDDVYSGVMDESKEGPEDSYFIPISPVKPSDAQNVDSLEIPSRKLLH